MISIKIDPVGKVRMTRADAWKKRPCVLRYWAFKDELLYKLGPAKDSVTTALLNGTCRMDFNIAMPKSWSKKKKDAMEGEPHLSRPDIDNICKSVLDCLMIEDSAVWRIECEKHWAKTGSIDFFIDQ